VKHCGYYWQALTIGSYMSKGSGLNTYVVIYSANMTINKCVVPER